MDRARRVRLPDHSAGLGDIAGPAGAGGSGSDLDARPRAATTTPPIAMAEPPAPSPTQRHQRLDAGMALPANRQCHLEALKTMCRQQLTAP